jgi:hypothetical protein
MKNTLSHMNSHTTFRCRGYTLMECVAALGLFSTCAVLVAPLATQCLLMRNDVDLRSQVQTELMNLAEADLNGLSTEIQPDAVLLARLASPEFQRHVSPAQGTPPGEQVTLSLRWKNSSGELGRPVELSYWKFSGSSPVSAEEESPRQLTTTTETSMTAGQAPRPGERQ